MPSGTWGVAMSSSVGSLNSVGSCTSGGFSAVAGGVALGCIELGGFGGVAHRSWRRHAAIGGHPAILEAQDDVGGAKSAKHDQHQQRHRRNEDHFFHVFDPVMTWVGRVMAAWDAWAIYRKPKASITYLTPPSG